MSWVRSHTVVQRVELALTHEIGHDVAHNNATAFEAFKKAGGWHAVDAKDLRADGLADDDIEKIRRSQQTSSEGPVVQNESSYYTRNVHDPKHEFWAQDKTATPAQHVTRDGISTGANESMLDDKGDDTWNYAKSNPAEHFADVYAKAVHVPEKLHADLVQMPQEAARAAHAQLEAKERELQALATSRRTAPGQIAMLEMEIEEARKAVAYADRAADQRGEQFRIMREDVFRTDKAATQARARLQFLNVDPKQLVAFDERAARLSTPEQIAALEQELRP